MSPDPIDPLQAFRAAMANGLSAGPTPTPAGFIALPPGHPLAAVLQSAIAKTKSSAHSAANPLGSPAVLDFRDMLAALPAALRELAAYQPSPAHRTQLLSVAAALDCLPPDAWATVVFCQMLVVPFLGDEEKKHFDNTLDAWFTQRPELTVKALDSVRTYAAAWQSRRSHQTSARRRLAIALPVVAIAAVAVGAAIGWLVAGR